METIKESNAFSNIVKAYTINENDEIEYFDLNFEDMNIHYSTDTDARLDKKFKQFISHIDEGELETIDINNEKDVSKIVMKMVILVRKSVKKLLRK